jgi:hypothetical protein
MESPCTAKVPNGFKTLSRDADGRLYSFSMLARNLTHEAAAIGSDAALERRKALSRIEPILRGFRFADFECALDSPIWRECSTVAADPSIKVSNSIVSSLGGITKGLTQMLVQVRWILSTHGDERA